MSDEERSHTPSELKDYSNLSPGTTFELEREELLEHVEMENAAEQSFRLFLQKLASNPNIEAVAISRIKHGGIYTDFFCKRYLEPRERGSFARNYS